MCIRDRYYIYIAEKTQILIPVHRFRNNYATRLSADLIAQELHTQIRILRDQYSYLPNDVLVM